MTQFHAVIMFRDDVQFGKPYAEVVAVGIRSGEHGFMIENVTDFVVEVFEEVPDATVEPS